VREEPPQDVFRRPTREQAPDAELRRFCAEALEKQATRLDAVYRLQMEAISRARAEEAALLEDVLDRVKPALPALASPLLVLDASAPSRPELLHLRALLLFGEIPRATTRLGSQSVEALLLREDAHFLHIRFTGLCTPTQLGRPAFAADRLEALEARHVLREHDVAEVADVLARALRVQTGWRRARVREAAAHVERLQALRVLLAR
jgi:hypothetical protein